ncbi:MAG: hypothetical protein LVQ96_03830 [Thermoplasmatales archaeon]|nr:hypothetical protein [Thermoplasmatales archaeon]MCW6170282.1 hypothetical protein [Thermoplasmatales archaeon]
MRIKTMVYGIYPKNENLRKKLSQWERDIISGKEICEAIDSEKRRIYELFQDNGITYYTDPLLNWYDIFRPLALSMEGIELGPLTRYLETNTFYRKPIVESVGGIQADPKDFFELKENPPLPLFNLDKNASLFFPSPYTFFKMSIVPDELDFLKFSRSILDNYAKIARVFGIQKIVLFESVPYGNDDISFLSDFARNFSLTLITTGNLGENNFKKFDSRLESVITDTEYLDVAQAHSRVPGVKFIDAHKTAMEKADGLKNFENYDDLILTTNDYLDFLPESIANSKVELLGTAGD